MKTDPALGKSYVLNDYEGMPYRTAVRQAFAQKKELSAVNNSPAVYWVKFTYHTLKVT